MRSLLIGALLMCLLFPEENVFAQDPKAGEKLFGANCQACHSIGKGKIVGPDLKDVTSRRKKEWLYKFIPSPMKMIQGGDEVAVKLFEEHNKIPMPDQSYLKQEDIDNILAYVDQQGSVAAAPKEEIKKDPAPQAKTQAAEAEPKVVLTAMDYFTYSMLAICIVLITLVIVLILQLFRSLKPVDQKA